MAYNNSRRIVQMFTLAKPDVHFLWRPVLHFYTKTVKNLYEKMEDDKIGNTKT